MQQSGIIIFIAGGPGAGKTNLATSIKSKYDHYSVDIVNANNIITEPVESTADIIIVEGLYALQACPLYTKPHVYSISIFIDLDLDVLRGRCALDDDADWNAKKILYTEQILPKKMSADIVVNDTMRALLIADIIITGIHARPTEWHRLIRLHGQIDPLMRPRRSLSVAMDYLNWNNTQCTAPYEEIRLKLLENPSLIIVRPNDFPYLIDGVHLTAWVPDDAMLTPNRIKDLVCPEVPPGDVIIFERTAKKSPRHFHILIKSDSADKVFV